MHLANTLLSFSSSSVPVSPKRDPSSRLPNASQTTNNGDEYYAYAKLQSSNWTYYVQKLSVTLGRSMEPCMPGPLHEFATVTDLNQLAEVANSSSQGSGNALDLHLAESEEISRRHLRIDYNFKTQNWELSCFGRQGVTVDGVSYEPFCSPIPLESRSEIKIGSHASFLFILPMDQEIASDEGGQRVDSPKSLEASSTDERKLKITLLLNKSQSARAHSASKKRIHVSARVNNEDEGDEDESSQDDGGYAKPALSYACLIAEAINSVPEQRLTLNAIYTFLTEKYPYFRHTKNGWQNSVRHNLSLNKAFMKIPRSPDEPGKGMFWSIDPNFAHTVAPPANFHASAAAAAQKRAKTRGRPPVSATPPPVLTPQFTQMYHNRLPTTTPESLTSPVAEIEGNFYGQLMMPFGGPSFAENTQENGGI